MGLDWEFNGMGTECERLSEVHNCIDRTTHELSTSTGQGSDERFLHINRGIEHQISQLFWQGMRAVVVLSKQGRFRWTILAKERVSGPCLQRAGLTVWLPDCIPVLAKTVLVKSDVLTWFCYSSCAGPTGAVVPCRTDVKTKMTVSFISIEGLSDLAIEIRMAVGFCRT